MRRLILALAVLASTGLGLAWAGGAWGQSESSAPRTLVDRLNQFGRRLIGDLSPGDRRQPSRSPTVASQEDRELAPGSRDRVSLKARAGSSITLVPKEQQPVTSQMPGPPVTEVSPSDRSPTLAPKTEKPAEEAAKPTEGATAENAPTPSLESNQGGSSSPETDPAEPSIPLAGNTSASAPVTAAPALSAAEAQAAAIASEIEARPLHERLTAFRQSPFKMPDVSKTDVAQGTPTASGSRTAEKPAETLEQAPMPSSLGGSPTPSLTDSTPRPQLSDRLPSDAKPSATPSASPTLSPTVPDAPALVAPSIVASEPSKPNETKPSETRPTKTIEPPKSLASQPTPARKASDEPVKAMEAAHPSEVAKPSERPAASPAGEGLLFTRQSPVLAVDTIGPKRIVVGKESTYEVVIQNTGPIAADQVVVSVELPAWADVLGGEPTAGTVQSPTGQGVREPLLWKVGRLEAKGREKLALRIVPRQSKPFDLAVKWDYTPAGTQTLIEVQEPKLAVQLHGPREVLFGKAELYRLEMSNPGTGDAENVMISLLPEGAGDNTPASHRLGTLAAGEKKVIEVELTARQAGSLTLRIDARADGGLAAQLTERISVQRPGLAVAVEAPSMQYVGSEVRYRISVKNPGTAPTSKVEVTATLPPGVKFVSASQNGRNLSVQNKVAWTLESVGPGTESALELVCVLGAPGTTRLQVVSTAHGDLVAQAAADVQVEAMADLALSVKDPTAPVPVGGDALYEVKIQNRGTKAAEQVDVVAYFSQGLEPATAEGTPNRLARGQIVFDTIPSIGPGETLVLKVTARAEQGGNHIIRTEVQCRPLGTRLVSEETTLFYDTQRSAQAPTQPVQPEPRSNGLRTANRREAASPPSPPNLKAPNQMPSRDGGASLGARPAWLENSTK